MPKRCAVLLTLTRTLKGWRLPLTNAPVPPGFEPRRRHAKWFVVIASDSLCVLLFLPHQLTLTSKATETSRPEPTRKMFGHFCNCFLSLRLPMLCMSITVIIFMNPIHLHVVKFPYLIIQSERTAWKNSRKKTQNKMIFYCVFECIHVIPLKNRLCRLLQFWYKMYYHHYVKIFGNVCNCFMAVYFPHTLDTTFP